MSRTELIPPQQLGMPHVPLIMQPRSKNYSVTGPDVDDDYVRVDFTNWSVDNGTLLTQVGWYPAQFRYFDETLWVTNWAANTVGSLPITLTIGTLDGVNLTVPNTPTASVPARSDGKTNYGWHQGVRITRNSLSMAEYVWSGSPSYAFATRFFDLSGAALSLTGEKIWRTVGEGMNVGQVVCAQTPSALGVLVPFSASYNSAVGVSNYDTNAAGYATNITHLANPLTITGGTTNQMNQIFTVNNSSLIAVSAGDGDAGSFPTNVSDAPNYVQCTNFSFSTGVGGMIAKGKFGFSQASYLDVVNVSSAQPASISRWTTPGGVGLVRLNDTQFLKITYTYANSAYTVSAQVFSVSLDGTAVTAVSAAQVIGTCPTILTAGARGFTLPGNRVFIWIEAGSSYSRSSYVGGYYCILKGAN